TTVALSAQAAINPSGRGSLYATATIAAIGSGNFPKAWVSWVELTAPASASYLQQETLSATAALTATPDSIPISASLSATGAATEAVAVQASASLTATGTLAPESGSRKAYVS